MTDDGVTYNPLTLLTLAEDSVTRPSRFRPGVPRYNSYKLGLSRAQAPLEGHYWYSPIISVHRPFPHLLRSHRPLSYLGGATRVAPGPVPGPSTHPTLERAPGRRPTVGLEESLHESRGGSGGLSPRRVVPRLFVHRSLRTRASSISWGFRPETSSTTRRTHPSSPGTSARSGPPKQDSRPPGTPKVQRPTLLAYRRSFRDCRRGLT